MTARTRGARAATTPRRGMEKRMGPTRCCFTRAPLPPRVEVERVTPPSAHPVDRDGEEERLRARVDGVDGVPEEKEQGRWGGRRLSSSSSFGTRARAAPAGAFDLGLGPPPFPAAPTRAGERERASGAEKADRGDQRAKARGEFDAPLEDAAAAERRLRQPVGLACHAARAIDACRRRLRADHRGHGSRRKVVFCVEEWCGSSRPLRCLIFFWMRPRAPGG